MNCKNKQFFGTYIVFWWQKFTFSHIYIMGLEKQLCGTVLLEKKSLIYIMKFMSVWNFKV